MPSPTGAWWVALSKRQRYWDISQRRPLPRRPLPGRGFSDPGEEAQPVRAAMPQLSDSAQVLTRLVLPGKACAGRGEGEDQSTELKLKYLHNPLI